jgi:tetratricopeptide (TPR) repeat protein
MQQENELSFRLLHCLAAMYAETGQVEKAQKYYAEGFERLIPHLMDGTPPDDFHYVPILTYDLGMQFFNQNDYEKTSLLCTQTLKWCPNFPPLNYLAGILLNTLVFSVGAAVYFEKCLQLGQEGNYYKDSPFDLIFITTYPAYNLGLMYLKVKQKQKALEAFEKVIEFDSDFTLAQEKINEIKQLL